MTIDDAIKHCNEVSNENRRSALEFERVNVYDAAKSCQSCAKEHEQLAMWLEELKQRREQEKHGRWDCGECTNCKRNLLELCCGDDCELSSHAEFDAEFCPFCGARMDGGACR